MCVFKCFYSITFPRFSFSLLIDSLTSRENKPKFYQNDDLDDLFAPRENAQNDDLEGALNDDLEDFLSSRGNEPEFHENNDFDEVLNAKEKESELHQNNDHGDFFYDWIESYM